MLRFTIRDVLWLTVVVALALALGMGWWRDRRAMSRRLEGAQIRIYTKEVALQQWKYLMSRPQGDINIIPPSDSDRQSWEETKAKSKELGAPQPKALRD